jgi:hypothetical protein
MILRGGSFRLIVILYLDDFFDMKNSEASRHTYQRNVYDWNATKKKCVDGVQLFEKRGQVVAQVRWLLHCVRQRGGRTG